MTAFDPKAHSVGKHLVEDAIGMFESSNVLAHPPSDMRREQYQLWHVQM
jgi:hypothetical protein